MTIYIYIYICCCSKNDHDALMSVFYFYRHLYLQTCGHIFRFRLSLEDKRGLSFGELIRPFCIMLYIDVYCIMGCYYTLCHNTYAYSLLFYKVYMKRGNAGSCNSGLEKEQILETYFAHLQKSGNSMKVIFGINKKYWRRNQRQGAHTLFTRVGACPPP